jgi:cytoplasmic iron level regulating protein YaaA (DUF328/UPF0246 family)
MLIVLSPAKTLDLEPVTLPVELTSPRFGEDTHALVEQMRTFDAESLKSLMKISDKLADLNVERFQDFRSDAPPADSKPALFAFKGDSYLGFELEEYSAEELEYAQSHLRILSGLYGLLRPLDALQPYRLEMGTRLKNDRGSNLYHFWGSRIREQLEADLEAQGDRVLINLASNEYFKSVQPRQLNANVITPVFKDYKNGAFKVISFFAKKARGAFANHILRHQLTTPESLQELSLDGYRFDPDSSNDTTYTYLRRQVV